MGRITFENGNLPDKSKIVMWFDANIKKFVYGIDLCYDGQWQHVLNEFDVPLLYRTRRAASKERKIIQEEYGILG